MQKRACLVRREVAPCECGGRKAAIRLVSKNLFPILTGATGNGGV